VETLAEEKRFLHPIKMKNLFLVLGLCLLPLFAHSSEENSPTLAVLENSDLFNPFPPGFMNPPDQPEGWVALPPGRPFPSLASDPRDLKLGMRKNNKNELEADVGGYRSFAGWKGKVKKEDTVVHIGLEGNAYFLLRQEGVKFPLHSSDGLIGFYSEAIRGLWLYQMRFTHLSAHLSDGLYNQRERFTYTRETLSLRVAHQMGVFRPYLGYHFLVHTKPVLPRHSLQLGFYSILPWHWKKVHPYFGADLRIRNSQEGTTYHITGGAALVSSLGAPPLRLSLNYLKGHDLRGQFYREKTDKWSLGLEMDF
jgi:hypothetical protein